MGDIRTSGYVTEQIRRTSRNLLIVNIGVAGFATLLFCGNLKWYYNMFSGPFEVDGKYFETYSDTSSDQREYLKINGDKVVDTGLTQVSQRKNKYTGTVNSEEITADYVLLRVGQKIVIVKAPHGQVAESYEGYFDSMESDVKRNIVDELEAKAPGFSEHLVPGIFKTKDYGSGGYLSLGFILGVLGLALFNMKKGIQRLNSQEASPIFQILKCYGDPTTIAGEIESERKGQLIKHKNLTRSKSWIFWETFFHTGIVRVDSIGWAYKHVTKKSVNFIPVGKDYAVILRTEFVDELQIPMASEDETHKFLEELFKSAPWIIVGFTDEIKTLWDRNRQEFMQAVRERMKRIS